MKSMLQEGSTIAHAIETAWAAVGKPQEFSIKVLQAEETSFFGFIQKRPAVVSISYDPVAQRAHSSQRRAPSRDQNGTSAQQGSRRTQNGRDGRDQRNGRDSRDAKESPFKPFQPKDDRPVREHREREPRKEQQRSMEPRKEHPGWSEPFASEIITDLKAILNDMKITTGFRHAIQKQQLVVTFDAPLFEETDLEKMFYASLAHLLLQLMKRRHRQAFSGYRLLLTNVTVGQQSESREPEDAA